MNGMQSCRLQGRYVAMFRKHGGEAKTFMSSTGPTRMACSTPRCCVIQFIRAVLRELYHEEGVADWHEQIHTGPGSDAVYA